ncbi:MAG TPA: hypothetical protein PKY82_09460 [Pyrinomonadaceae bacterium]|nr:hypothetical protein [Pyrinomonadaceae bacterium]
MSIRKNFTIASFAFIAALFVIFGNASNTYAQAGNMYEEPWQPAARFAIKEGSKRENATIKMVKMREANFTTGEAGLDFTIYMEITLKKANKKAVTKYVQTNVFRDDKKMAYTLKSWKLFDAPPDENK